MRILMVSMNSIHFQRWTNQLKDSDHEVFWFDIKDGAKVPSLSWVNAIQNWKLKYPNLKGRHSLKKYAPKLHKVIENDTAKAFEKVLLDVKPDAVHSFILYLSCVPILEVMQKHKNVKWIYSSWGSDLFYYRNIPKYKQDIISVLPRVNYLFTDCNRDVSLAKQMGFKGDVLGTFPGGGGYDFLISDKFIKTPVLKRDIILIKGYQDRSGKAIEVLKAILEIPTELKPYKIIVFGADNEVDTFISKNKMDTIKIYSKSHFLPHQEILKLMGEALIYIGNSNSDGMPNTLLEAVIQGAFPIQSNPGGASEDIIVDKKNGLLIEDCNAIKEIKEQILFAINNPKLIESAFLFNQNAVKPKLEMDTIKQQVLSAYSVTNHKN